ncbi:hypothetical protein SPI_01952 [Niveomyces insectorum RCEF 264]|uniref:LYR motif-containing protein Cup1-like N-terminal domain-containing protein n=1 Tax=Niveomyces insectorum RCEF 264 TaxID=1081102 RepID=A0A167XMR2_9HYPO|nr:hypothetical protein SPI_01952 [Niveomyces insectorum RCEF 264]
MSAPMGLPQPRNAVHIYRHLLREASYLPPVCRARIEPRIRLRFRRHRRDPAPDKRLRQASHDLRFLRAANHGDMTRMRKIVQLAFGRIGWRYHELMRRLRQPDQPDSAAQLEADLRRVRAADDWLDRWDTEKLLAFARSQSQYKLRDSPRPQASAKRLDPAEAVPATNAWGRPFAEKPARTKLRKWWKSLARRSLPPVPQGEWELLKQLATGQAGTAGHVPARRAMVQATQATHASLASTPAPEDEWEWEKYATRPIRSVERSRARRFCIARGLGPPPPDSPYEGPAIGIHRYTARFWRRLYADVWRMTATMERKPGQAQRAWDITWGGVPLRPASPLAGKYESFEGVDSTGMPLNQPEETGLATTKGAQRRKDKKDV